MSSTDPCDQVLSRYITPSTLSSSSTPLFLSFKAKHRESLQPFSIKVTSRRSDQLFQYLSHIKDTKSQYVIRIIQLVRSTTKLVMVCEQSTYGTLESAMKRCQRLQDADALTVAKGLLHGRIDLLRNQCEWVGGEADVDVTETGVKLSWGGREVAAGNMGNTFPVLLRRLGSSEGEQRGILPFPPSKQLMDLIKVCVENASEMSLHPLLKKREKPLKKKGKGWLAIRQWKAKAEYFEENVYTAVSPTHGFVRVKVYALGAVPKEVMTLHRSHPGFVRILETTEEVNSMTFVSEYANDGNLQAYVNRLKTAAVTLRQDQIQFLLYSLIDPLKLVQKSPIASLNTTIHIKNIFLQNGIPKLGQPIPMTPNLDESLRQRSDVPDFYHPKFKSLPSSHSAEYDTYSLGILLYKLMYTEYPIFPQGRVHVPTTPSYNQRIKSTLMVFLNEGGTLAEVEQKIEVSEAVKMQIKANKARNPVVVETMEVVMAEEDKEEVGQKKGFWARLCEHQEDTSRIYVNSKFFQDLESSPYRKYRICTKIILVLSIYLFMLYLAMWNGAVELFSQSRLLQPYNVTIGNATYPVVTADSFALDTALNNTGRTLTGLTTGLNCLVDNKSLYSNFAESGMWYGYLSTGLILSLIILFVKAWQLHIFDLMKAVNNQQLGLANYNISAWVMFHLISCLAIFSHFFFYHYMFFQQSQPCLGGSGWFSSDQGLFNDRTRLMTMISPVFIACLVLGLLSFLELVFHEKIKYSKLLNPLVVLLPFYLALTIMMRVGVYTPVKPSWVDSDIITGYFRTSVPGAVGTFPELMLIFEVAVSFLIDFLFFRFFDRKMTKLLEQQPLDPQPLDQSSDALRV